MTQRDKGVRLCHLSTVHPAGDARIFFRQCRNLAKHGYEVHLIARSDRSEVKDNVKVHALPQTKSRFVRIFLLTWVALFRAMKTRSKVYHYHDPELIFAGFVLRWIFFRKVIYDVHESVHRQILSKTWLPKAGRRIIAAIYRMAERALTIGQVMILANEGSLDDYHRPVYLVRNYPELPPDIDRMLTAVKKDPAVPTLVYVGGVAVIRGALQYLELARGLKEKNINFKMRIIGPVDPELKMELDDKVKKYGLEEHVAFTGFMATDEAIKQVAQATLGLCLLYPEPNYVTCLATKILEYMMCGVPVLASNFDHWKKYVLDEGTGMMVDPCDIGQILSACLEMLSDRQLLEKMGTRGRIAVREKYNWASEMKTLLKCYDEILK